MEEERNERQEAIDKALTALNEATQVLARPRPRYGGGSEAMTNQPPTPEERRRQGELRGGQRIEDGEVYPPTPEEQGERTLRADVVGICETCGSEPFPIMTHAHVCGETHLRPFWKAKLARMASDLQAAQERIEQLEEALRKTATDATAAFDLYEGTDHELLTLLLAVSEDARAALNPKGQTDGE